VRSGVGGVGVDVVAPDGVVDDRGLDLAVAGESPQCGHHDVAGVDLEEPAQRLAGVAAAEAVGAERHEGAGDPAADLVGHEGHVVGDRHHRPVAVGQQLGDPRGAALLAGVQAVPPLGGQRLLAQAL
jgi:hypothetical protein